MDNDVLKALHNVDIDKNSFPNVYQWHNALTKYSLEERARYVFESHLPSIIRCIEINFVSFILFCFSAFHSQSAVMAVLLNHHRRCDHQGPH